MTILIWWTMASIVVSLAVGAFLALGRRETTIDLEVGSALRKVAVPAADAVPLDTA